MDRFIITVPDVIRSLDRAAARDFFAARNDAEVAAARNALADRAQHGAIEVR